MTNKPTEQQAARIVDLYRRGATGYEVAVELGEKLTRVYAVLRERLTQEELVAVRRQRNASTRRSQAHRLAARWLDALPRLRTGARARLMTLERRCTFAEHLERLLARGMIFTDDAGFLEGALAFSEIRPDTFIVELAPPHDECDARLLTRHDLDDVSVVESDAHWLAAHAEERRLACIVSKGARFDALEAEIALLAIE